MHDFSHDRKILFVGPDGDSDSETFRRLSELRLEVDRAADGQEALKSCLRRSYKLVVVQLKDPVSQGLSFVRLLKLRQPEIPVLVFSDHLSLPELATAFRWGVTDCLAANLRLEEFRGRIEGFIEPSKV